MNNQRRKQIAQIISGLSPYMEATTWAEYQQALNDTPLKSLANDAEAIRDEEQEAMENLPDSLREGDKGERMQEAIDALDSAAQDLEGIEPDEASFSPEDLNDALQTVIDSLDEASQ